MCAEYASAGGATAGSIRVESRRERRNSARRAVTATSPALQLPRWEITDGKGDYRCAVAVATKSGVHHLRIQTVRRDGCGSPWVCRASGSGLEVGAIEESVTVFATPPIYVQSTGAVNVLTESAQVVSPIAPDHHV